MECSLILKDSTKIWKVQEIWIFEKFEIFIKGSKILVIGGAGFIGSFVVAELLKDEVAEVVVFDNF